jgi:ATP-binding cassette subfamily B protein/subfamily B ATP-binding cassette protein MsbA
MKNFLRALRSSWPYRGRLIASLVCALIAALLWGLSFTAISPVLEILDQKPGRKNLQELTATKIDEIEGKISIWQRERAEPEEEANRLRILPPNDHREKRLRDLTTRLTRLDGELQSANRQLYLYRVIRWRLLPLLPTDPFQTLVWLFGLVVFAVLLRGFFEFCQESLVGSVVNLSLFDLRNRLYRRVVHLDVNDFNEEGTHELMARFTNDMEMLGNGTKTLLGKVVAEPLKGLVCVLLACWISWQLTLMFLVLVPAAFFVLTKVGRLMKRATRKLLERMANLYKILQETFQGIRVVKGFTMEPYERRRFCTATREYYHRAMWVVNLDALTSPIIELLGVAAIAAALLAGAYLVLRGQDKLFNVLQVINGRLDHVTLLQLYALLASVADPVRKLSSVYTRIQSGGAAADRIFAIMDREPRVHANIGGPRLASHGASIEFREVCFSYDPGRPILTNVHLRVRHGESIALVGKNGSGKTTLVGLIPRFYDPDHGSVLIDDRNIRGVNLRSLRQQIGIVTQDTMLFDDTVYNNIAYGNRRARPEDVEDAARRAYAHDFIVRLGNGYQTRVGETGSKLSGGQRQRLALARAILRDPRILILDEFTSQSDVESESLTHRALREFMRGRTTFLITHRLNTLEIADRIVVIEGGRVVAVGTHAELLQSCLEYQRLHEVHARRLSA